MRRWFAAFCSCVILFLAVTCPDPTPANGSLSHTFPPPYNGAYLESSVVIYSCDSGYNIIGSVYSFCKANKNWDPAPATCIGNNSIVWTVILHEIYIKLYSITFVQFCRIISFGILYSINSCPFVGEHIL